MRAPEEGQDSWREIEYVDGKLTVAIEKDEGDGHEDGVPVEGDAHVLHIGHTTLESGCRSLFVSVFYP